MPLTSHRKGSRDGGSAQSSPARSPENVVHEVHPPVNQMRCSNSSQVAVPETNAKSHVSVSASIGHSSGEERLSSARSVSNIPSVGWEAQSHSERSINSASHTYHRSHHQHHGFGWGEKDKVTLLVDGKRFIINPNLLTKHPNTMLGRCVCMCVCICMYAGRRERVCSMCTLLAVIAHT